jgi:IS30 family transposase
MRRISYEERQIIEKLRKSGVKVRKIAKILDRSHSTISEEISRNKQMHEDYYDAETAQGKMERRVLRRGNKPKIRGDSNLENEIVERLKEEHSPEQIAGSLALKYKQKVISHETIYRFIYSKRGIEFKLWKHLRRKRSKRKKVAERKQNKRTLIPERISIHERPKVVDKRLRIGDLETDSVIFREAKSILSVQIDRASLKCAITKVENKSATETKLALIRAIEDEFGAHNTKTITFDNGTENVKHIEIKEEYKTIKTFFCDPYSSWQKGSVENLNGLIRQYLPRKLNLDEITQDQIYEIQEKLNNRPRKKLGFKSPNQFFYEMLRL